MSADREAPVTVYERPRSDRPAPHEYWDATRRRTEDARLHEGRKVLDSFLTTDGRIIVLARDIGLDRPWAVGVYGQPGTEEYYDVAPAGIEFARRIAESFGPHAPATADAKAVTPLKRDQLQALAWEYGKAALDYRQSAFVNNETARLTASITMRDRATALVVVLEEVGLVAGVTEHWRMR